MTNIFISYSRNDRPVVQHMASALQHEGFNVWWDTEIPPGSTFADVIDKRLNEADCVLVIWSSSSVKSNWVQEEADDGLQSGRLIPVMIEEIDLPRGFKRLQTANLINWQGDRQAPEWVRVLSEVRRLVTQGQRAATVKPTDKRTQTPAANAPIKHANPRRVTQQAAKQKNSGGRGLVWGLLAMVVVAASAGGYYFMMSDAETQPIATSEPAAADSSEAKTAEAEIETVDESDSGDVTIETVAPELTTANETVASDPANAEAADGLDSALADIAAEAVAEPVKPGPGDLIKDCESCPELIVIAGGASVMGAADGEYSSEAVEKPQIKLHLDYSFAIGRYEVTYDQWAACLADGRCDGYQPNDHGWGMGARPVINVTYENVQEYLSWLSDETGAKYRLPSEAEWEFAARSGTTTPFSTGELISTQQANFNGQYPYVGGVKERSAGKTLAVGSFSPNAFGLHDMQGNVWEWVSDCWRDSHRNADASGSPVGGSCTQRVLKGGAWNGGAWRARVAHRKPAKVSTSDYDTGFRVVREF